MKKNRFILILSLVFTAFIVSNLNFYRIRIDGLDGELLSLFFKPDTKYADGYSHKAFINIKPGMKEHEVIDILGKPVKRWKPYYHTTFNDKWHFTGLVYSESHSDTHYRIRQVILNKGVVTEIRAYFYVD